MLVLTARDPRPFATALRRLERAGADVVVIACGAAAETEAARARTRWGSPPDGPSSTPTGAPPSDWSSPRDRPVSAEAVDQPGTNPGPSPARRMPSPLVLAPIALAILAEAAWTAVLAGMLQAFALRGPTLGIPGTLVACLAGLAAAKWLDPRAGDRWPALAAALTIGIAIVGWLASPEVRSILGERGIDAIGAAIIANLGGFVAGIAFLRGVPYARLPPDPGPIGTALAVGTPGIALAAIVGGMVGDPYRAAFLSDTTGEVVVFLVAGIAALTLSRLTMVGSGAGAGSVDWRRNPAWLGLAAFLLAGIAVTAFATSAVAGPVIVTVLGVMIPSLLILGFVIGFDRRSLRIVAITMVLMLVVAEVLRVLGAKPEAAPPIAPPAPPAQQAVATPDSAILVVIALALAAVVIVAVVTRWMRRDWEGGAAFFGRVCRDPARSPGEAAPVSRRPRAAGARSHQTPQD